ncbi:MAG: DNA repair protein RecO C-terminal domain-containing protein [Prevotellaceae bacterium]|jgi:DNA repair protein RecO (recombination protein O)|nr:DNA repair protein RecO C-terminal domain-containing protein [Prevotellaceae bacterium]
MKGVVLSGIKYTDNQDIVYLYTDLKGRRTYILNRRKKGNRLFPLSLIDFECSGRQNAEIQYLKEFVFSPLLLEISSDIRKSSIAMFIGEFLYRILKEEDSSSTLFEYIYQSICLLDALHDGVPNFHLYFMVQLSKYMGFSISSNINSYDYFDIKYCKFVFTQPLHPQFFDKDNTKILSCLLNLPVNQLNTLKLTREQRISFANRMLDFYSCRFDHTLIIKSLNVLHEIFG